MKRSELGQQQQEESLSLSHSPSSPMQNSWSHDNNLLPGDSSTSSSRFCLGSPSDHSLSSYFSSGLCDGSSQFTSPPLNGMMHATRTKYNHDVSLRESLLHLLNIRQEEEQQQEKNHHQYFTENQLSNYDHSDDDGFGPGGSSGFQSYGETSCNMRYESAERPARSMVSSLNRSMIEPSIFNNSLILEANNTFNNLSVPSYSHRRSCFGSLSDHHHQGSSMNVRYFQGYVYLMAKDQQGCRSLERVLEDGTSLDAMIIYNEVIPHVVELMINPFGNYLMQKLLDVCNEEQRTKIILIVTSEPGLLVRIALNAYGTRVVQRLVESIKTKKQIYLVKSALRNGFLNLVRDVNGNHVIQRCLQCLTTQDNKFIFEDATRFCIDMATHKHGCCILQKCVAYSSGQQREKLITEISRNSLFLAQDPYGNYAVQYVIEMNDFQATAMVLAELKGHYVELSIQKFSSHMVERCLRNCPESRPQIVLELISFPRFDLLIQDPFANFVIQAALSVTKGSLHAILVEVIRPHSNLRKNPYCKWIFSSNILMKKKI